MNFKFIKFKIITMDVLITPICDIVKHLVEKNWIQTDDAKFNLLLYSFSSIFISFIAKYVINLEIMNLIQKIKWYWDYVILRKEIFIFPYLSYDLLYSNTDVSKALVYTNITGKKNTTEFMSILNNILKEHVDKKNKYIEFRTFNFDNSDMKISEDTVTHKTRELCYIFGSSETKSDDKDDKNIYYKVCYVNGHYIYACILDDDTIKFSSNDKMNLDIFLNHLKTYRNSIKEKLVKKDLKVCEYKNNNIISLGDVKKDAVFENYVSKYKEVIIKKLDAVKNGNLYKDNPYIENNLGILLHGNFGTGKSFLISAVANYIKRDILNISFANIKTKEDFREVFNDENHQKYVYCFDEFDYLLDELLGETNNFEEENKSKIQLLSTQISLLKDSNKEATENLIKQMKDLMENNEKFTYATFLSELSGLKSRQNCIIIATTNFIDKIPHALTRPGRFDFVLNLNFFNGDEIKELLIKLYNPSEKDKQKILKTTFQENKFTPSQIILKRCEYEDLSDMIKFLS